MVALNLYFINFEYHISHTPKKKNNNNNNNNLSQLNCNVTT
ncbi:MAG: hypothetical protein N7Q72_02225 [Spiroplasma sp. Tabriz.8]|nr:hypothetical protein [Spiroplasma sp. Tabriz.8]